ncbi:MAG: YncE family protein [Acidobacteriota bacterium]|nr:YncE family protein [Acidobacteriota bacterium]
MRAVSAVLVLALASSLAPRIVAQSTPSPALLVLSKADDTLAIVDPATLRVVAKAPVGEDPHEVIASSDGRTAYVSNYGFGRYHTIAVIDLVGQKALASIDLGPLRGPHGLDFVAGKLWFTAEAAKVIGRYDPATGTVDWVMGTGQNRTHMVYVFPDLKRIVTTNVASASVTVMDKTDGPAGMPAGMRPPPGARMPGPLGGDWNETVIPVGHGSEGFDITPDGKTAWVANAQDGTISVVDLDAKKVTATLAADVRSANRIKFTTDGKLALVSLLGSPDLVILDAATQKVIKRLPIGHGAAGILIDPGGARAYVSCGPDNYVAVIDLKTLAVAGHIDAGGNPDGLAWAVQH